MPVKVASEWLNSCSGCEIAILNLGETLLDLLPELDFVHIPVLMDHKHLGQLGDKEHMEIPKATVGLLSGGIRNGRRPPGSSSTAGPWMQEPARTSPVRPTAGGRRMFPPAPGSADLGREPTPLRRSAAR